MRCNFTTWNPPWKPFIGSPHWPSWFFPRWPAPTVDSGIAKWLPVNPTATSLAKNSKDKLIPGIKSGRDLSGANVPTLTWKTCHHLDPGKFTVYQWPFVFFVGIHISTWKNGKRLPIGGIIESQGFKHSTKPSCFKSSKSLTTLPTWKGHVHFKRGRSFEFIWKLSELGHVIEALFFNLYNQLLILWTRNSKPQGFAVSLWWMTVGSWWLHSFRMANQYKRMGGKLSLLAARFCKVINTNTETLSAKLLGHVPWSAQKKR